MAGLRRELGAAEAMALWILHAHAHDASVISPILAITSPTPECGKTTTLTALAMLVQTIAVENVDAGLTANVILPGTMDTPANRKSMPDAVFSKWAKTDDVADLVLSLAGDQARHLTGLAIPIEGGRG